MDEHLLLQQHCMLPCMETNWLVSMGYCWVNANICSPGSKQDGRGIRRGELFEWLRPSVPTLRKENSRLCCMLIRNVIGSAVTSGEWDHPGTIECRPLYIYQSACFSLCCLNCNFRRTKMGLNYASPVPQTPILIKMWSVLFVQVSCSLMHSILLICITRLKFISVPLMFRQKVLGLKIFLWSAWALTMSPFIQNSCFRRILFVKQKN